MLTPAGYKPAPQFFPPLLEPLGAQQRREQVDEQQRGNEDGQPDHGGPSYTLSQAATNANIAPSAASPSSSMAGSQTDRSNASTAVLLLGGTASEECTGRAGRAAIRLPLRPQRLGERPPPGPGRGALQNARTGL